MEKEKIFKEIITIVEEYAKETDQLASASMDTDIIKVLKVNSARLVDIIINFEDAFDIDIDMQTKSKPLVMLSVSSKAKLTHKRSLNRWIKA